METPTNVLSGFAYYLADNGLLDKEVAMNALQKATLNKISYIDYLVKEKILDELQAARITADYFGLPLCDVTAFDVTHIPTKFLSIHLVKKHLALPLFTKNNVIFVAVSDPTIESLSELRFLTGMETRLLIVVASKLNQTINKMLKSQILTEVTIAESDTGVVAEDLSTVDVESAPVISYVNSVLLDAIDKGASDIHFEHYEDTYRIRLRVHGVLYPVMAPPLKLANYVLARIKVMSNLDITEHRIPQDGRFKLIVSKKRAIDFRVSVCPTLFGEKIVLRILDPTQATQELDHLGMDATQKEHLVDALRSSQGMILVTGPTGSGKTVTLYSSLTFLNTIEKNISTVEDPVEIPLLGINQVHVNPKVGLTFAAVLRAFLRQDPDIIMLGEIRDLETAEIAVKASQTGHLVLSTLHTNSAPETITRLMNMGIEPYNLASSLLVIIAQRLLRLLCPHCKKKEDIPEEALLKEGFTREEIGTFQLYTAGTCDRCMHGYKGRVGIFEVLPISKDMANLIMQGGTSLDIIELAKKEGVINLRESGLIKVKQGVTSLAELNRVFK